ncbi:hypothetical protein [Arthrobacter sp. zg-Y1110]|uniref:hypothetical protein n=1 Tax=Arthrobacter sp. zg-Y1110 TaxID=2886932 RepID=UPI001D142792|nr:hypothetical protein [Arthrobacter sp. zg-Y1110]MCC3292425.1 hypothetical protein [Arthrobacter sp. zg-Y1110]UWX87139.1 hypothetical protein N2K99_17660 [Arthrobacter sp. zg-Y1110]
MAMPSFTAGTAGRRPRPILFLIGLMFLLAFVAAAAPSPENTVVESIALTGMAVVSTFVAFSACGYFGMNLKITGITADVVAVAVAAGLCNNSHTAAGAYLIICLILAHAGASLVRFSLPLRKAVRPA